VYKLRPLFILSLLVVTALLASPMAVSSYSQTSSSIPPTKAGASEAIAAVNLPSLSLQSIGRTADTEPSTLGENQGAGGGGQPNGQSGQPGLAPVPHLSRNAPIDLSSAGSAATQTLSTSDTPPQVIYPNAPSTAISSSPERKLFYSSGYWWAFWQESSSPFDCVYSSSPDEATWSSPAAVVSGPSYQCECASVWVSGGTVYYAQTTGTNDFVYESGTIAGGAITWSAATTVPTVYNTQDTSGYQSSISVITDSLGDPWVAVYAENGAAGAGAQYAEVYEYAGGAWAAESLPIASPNIGPEFPGGWVQMVPLPEPSPGVPGVAVLYSFVDCSGCFTGVNRQYTTGISGGVSTWSTVVGAGADYAEFSATAVGNTIYIAGSLGSGGVDFSYYTTGQPAASSPVSIATGTAWTRFGSSGGTDVSISQGASGSDTLVIFYENFIADNVDYSVGSIGTGGAVTWGATQDIYSTPPPSSEVFGVSSADTATAGDEFGVVFTLYPGGIIQLYFASITVSTSLASPTISTTPSPTGETLGTSTVALEDTATLAGGNSPTGAITHPILQWRQHPCRH
jgi:hypothetical protein